MNDHDDDISSPILGRRQLLRSVSALGILGLGGTALARSAAGSVGAAASHAGATAFASNVATLDSVLAGMCVMTPTAIQGPFYLNLNLLRTDITEGVLGYPMRLVLRLVQAADCAPIANAVCDVWHNDPAGDYSGFASRGTPGQTWLRGVQITDANGIAHFDTIYPGWYTGRTPHIHLKVRPTGSTELTTQLYFQQRLSSRIYARPPYLAHGPNPVTNATDNFFTPDTLARALVDPGTGLLHCGLTIGVA